MTCKLEGRKQNENHKSSLYISKDQNTELPEYKTETFLQRQIVSLSRKQEFKEKRKNNKQLFERLNELSMTKMLDKYSTSLRLLKTRTISKIFQGERTDHWKKEGQSDWHLTPHQMSRKWKTKEEDCQYTRKGTLILECYTFLNCQTHLTD